MLGKSALTLTGLALLVVIGSTLVSVQSSGFDCSTLRAIDDASGAALKFNLSALQKWPRGFKAQTYIPNSGYAWFHWVVCGKTYCTPQYAGACLSLGPVPQQLGDFDMQSIVYNRANQTITFNLTPYVVKNSKIVIKCDPNAVTPQNMSVDASIFRRPVMSLSSICLPFSSHTPAASCGANSSDHRPRNSGRQGIHLSELELQL